MKIFDCFLYNGENFILDIRLNILSGIVNKFVIVESKYDHQGNKKKLKLNLDDFASFKDKITYLVIDRFPKNFTSWERENFQRNYLINGLNEADDNDYIII
jgi:beta-1,4-mannosyl-glycoprotein beta-1,4-N-acetylglucosaminyltransferase